MRALLPVTAATLAALTQTVPAQDLAAGEQSFKKCFPCHSVGERPINKAGPALNGLEGRKAGAVPGYNYSEANRNSGLVWSEEAFRDYIKNPLAKMPGTKMFFAGIKSDKEIGNLWAYLKQFGPDGKIK